MGKEEAVPYGPEWLEENKDLSKHDLVSLLRAVGLQSIAYRNEIIRREDIVQNAVGAKMILDSKIQELQESLNRASKCCEEQRVELEVYRGMTS